MSASQAERRRFDPGLPLHFSITWVYPTILTLHFTPLSCKYAFFELFCRFGSPSEADFSVDIKRHPNSVSALVSGYLRIGTDLVTEAGVGPT
jgi:hypothetical protein